MHILASASKSEMLLTIQFQKYISTYLLVHVAP